MAGVGGVQPTLIAPLLKAASFGGLRPGQQGQGVIGGAAGNLTLQIRGARMSLGPEASFQPGQAVQVSVSQTANGIQVQISSAPNAPPPSIAEAPPTPVLVPIATETAAQAMPHQSYGALGSIDKRELLSMFLPRAAGGDATVATRLLQLFTSPDSTSENLTVLRGLLLEASRAGVVGAEVFEKFAGLITNIVSQDWKNLIPILQRAVRQSRKTWESRMLEPLEGEPGAESALQTDDVREFLTRIRGLESLSRWLKQSGNYDVFERCAREVMERATAAHLQNLHGLTAPYAFVEAPFERDSGFRHVRIHIFGEGPPIVRIDGSRVSVVLEIDTENLGPLWIRLDNFEDACRCVFRVASDDIAGLIGDSSDELVDELVRAGFSKTTVDVETNAEAPIVATARLMQRFTGVDLAT